MAASLADRTHVRAVESAVESQVLLADIARIDAAQDLRRAKCEQLLGEAQQQLALIDRLDHLEDEAHIKLRATLREIAGLVDGVPS